MQMQQLHKEFKQPKQLQDNKRIETDTEVEHQKKANNTFKAQESTVKSIEILNTEQSEKKLSEKKSTLKTQHLEEEDVSSKFQDDEGQSQEDYESTLQEKPQEVSQTKTKQNYQDDEVSINCDYEDVDEESDIEEGMKDQTESEYDADSESEQKEKAINDFLANQRQLESKQKPQKCLKCYYCYNEYNNSKTLWEHQATKHPFKLLEYYKRGFVCQFCYRFYFTLDQRNQHEENPCFKKPSSNKKAKNSYQKNIDSLFEEMKSLKANYSQRLKKQSFSRKEKRKNNKK